MPTVDLPQGAVHYHHAQPTAQPSATGRADPPVVVFVHGLLVAGGLWRKAADALARDGIESFTPDLPLGAHPIPLHPDADPSPRGVARLILDFLAKLDLHDVVLVGNDTGGALCQFALDIDPTRIGRLVLTNCDAFDKFPPAPFGLLFKFGRSATRLNALIQPMRSAFIRAAALAPLSRTKLDSAMTKTWLDAALNQPEVRRDAANFMKAIDPADLLDVSTRFGRFDKPVLILWGTGDRFFKPALGHRLRDAFPNAQFVEIPGGRTFVGWDEPEQVARQVAEFARGTDPATNP
jgi:pimeloyl-ACP methyl ester carboxylesterase